MSMFSGIMEKLGFNKSAQQTANASIAAANPQSPPPPTDVKITSAAPQATPPSASTAPTAPTAIPVVDVMGQLDKLAAASSQPLNWKTSIVDMLKLLGLDSSPAARKTLAIELGCPPEKLGDSAQMNMWLHKTVLEKLAQNGGNVPKDLLH
jgi:hypothetical protein